MTGYKQPPRRRTPQVHIRRRNAIRSRLLADYEQGMTWAAVGAQFGISAGMAFRVAVQGYKPRKVGEWRRLRQAMGLVRPRRNVRQIVMAALGLPWS